VIGWWKIIFILIEVALELVMWSSSSV